MHQALAGGHGLAVPIGRFAAAPVHGIEAEILRGGDLRPQARRHGLALAGQDAFDLAVPLLRMRGSRRGRPARRRPWRWIRTTPTRPPKGRKWRARDNPTSRRRAIAQLGAVQFLEAAAEVHQQQVALVAQEGIEGALPAVGRKFHGAPRPPRPPEDRGAFGGGQRSPGGPAEAHHLVQHAGAFHSERDGRQGGFGRASRAS